MTDDIKLADWKLIQPLDRQPGPMSRFFLQHAGGYDAQYYTKQEAHKAASLAAAKFVSVSFATFSFMKAVHPAFDAVSPDLRGYFTALAAGGLWWGISKLDTEVMHSMRAQRAAKKAEDDFGIKDTKGGPTWPGYAFRIGISLGSLGISIPALLIAASQGTVDTSIKDRLNNRNAPIVEEYRGRLADTDRSISSLRTRLSSLQQQLAITQSPDGILTSEERARIGELTNALQQAANDQQKKQQELEAAEKKRDEATGKMGQEDMGARGSLRGKGPLYLTALADQQDAERDMARIRASLAQLQTITDSAKVEMGTIRSHADNKPGAQRPATATLAQTLQDQITQVSGDLDKQVALRATLANIDDLSGRDQRFRAFKPDMAQQIDAYLTFMRTEASPMEWSRQIFMTMIIVSLELGVFAMASTRKTNPGELRGYMAEVLNSEQIRILAAKTSEDIKMAMEADTDDETIALGKRVSIIKADAKAFAEELDKVQKDPQRRQAYADEIAELLEWLRLNPSGPESTEPSNVKPFRKPRPS